MNTVALIETAANKIREALGNDFAVTIQSENTIRVGWEPMGESGRTDRLFTHLVWVALNGEGVEYDLATTIHMRTDHALYPAARSMARLTDAIIAKTVKG